MGSQIADFPFTSVCMIAPSWNLLCLFIEELLTSLLELLYFVCCDAFNVTDYCPLKRFQVSCLVAMILFINAF